LAADGACSKTKREAAAMTRIVQDLVARAVGAVGLAAIALIHVLDTVSKFDETPYVGWLYVGLIVGCLAAASLLVRGSARAGWSLGAGLALTAIAGYVTSRTVGLPNATQDIGNWSEPLGLAALFVEGCVLALCTWRLAGGGASQAHLARLEPVASDAA